MDKATFDIPAHLVDKVHDRIKQLNKRAERIGCELITIEIGEVEYRKVGRFLADWVEVTICGDPPMYDGWVFIASVEHTSDAGNIVRIRHGSANPYKHVDNTCDHCKVDRGRNSTYVIEHEVTGERKRLGRVCLKDFMGHSDPQNLARACELYYDLLEEMEEMGGCDDFDFQGGSASLTVTTYIEACVMAIDRFGWVSRSSIQNEYDERTTTASTAIDIVVHDGIRESATADPKWATPAQIKKAAAVVDWVADLTDEECWGNDYLHNLRATIVGRADKGLKMKHLGIAASAVSAYDRAMTKQREIEKAAAESVSEYVGKLKKRQKFTDLTLVKLITLPDYGWGCSWLCIYEDADGNELKWKSSKWRDFTEGAIYEGRATPTKHDEYNGVKQTTINRCDFVAIYTPETGDEDEEDYEVIEGQAW